MSHALLPLYDAKAQMSTNILDLSCLLHFQPETGHAYHVRLDMPTGRLPAGDVEQGCFRTKARTQAISKSLRSTLNAHILMEVPLWRARLAPCRHPWPQYADARLQRVQKLAEQEFEDTEPTKNNTSESIAQAADTSVSEDAA